MLRNLGKKLFSVTESTVKSLPFLTRSAAPVTLVSHHDLVLPNKKQITPFRVNEGTRQHSSFFAKRKDVSNLSLNLAVGDISGTYMDWFSYSPIAALIKLFTKYHIALTPEEARVPMGKHKKVHLRELFNLPRVAPSTETVREKWRVAYGFTLPSNDVERMNEERAINQLVDAMFLDLKCIQLSVLQNNVDEISEFIPNALEAHEELRQMGLTMTATTGFIREMAEVLLTPAAMRGLRFATTVAGDEVENGSRMHPHMLHKVMAITNLYDKRRVVKFGDTREDIGEGLNAGVWTVGLYGYSNYVNLTGRAAFDSMLARDPGELERRLEESAGILRDAGAHYVVKSIADMPAVVQDINKRLQKGEVPESASKVEREEEFNALQFMAYRV